MQGHQKNSEDKTVHHQSIKTNPIQSLKREQRTMMMQNLHNPSTRPRYSLEVKSRRRSHKEVRGKRKELVSSLHTCQGYDTQMLLMHGLSYGPALTRNTKERASVCRSDQLGLRPPRVTHHTIFLTRTVFNSMSFIPNCRTEYITSSVLSVVRRIFLQSVHQLNFINRSSNLLAERGCIIVLWVQ